MVAFRCSNFGTVSLTHIPVSNCELAETFLFNIPCNGNCLKWLVRGQEGHLESIIKTVETSYKLLQLFFHPHFLTSGVVFVRMNCH